MYKIYGLLLYYIYNIYNYNYIIYYNNNIIYCIYYYILQVKSVSAEDCYYI